MTKAKEINLNMIFKIDAILNDTNYKIPEDEWSEAIFIEE